MTYFVFYKVRANEYSKKKQGQTSILLIFSYCPIWIICFRKNNLFKTIALSVIPSVVFLFSGFLSRHLLLIIFTVIFAPSHIGLSVGNKKNLRSLINKYYNRKLL